MPRIAILLTGVLAASCGVFGLSSEERAELAQFQRNSKLYLEGGLYQKALEMTRKGLEIDPTDYNLRMVRATCLWFLARSNPALLESADRAFRELLTARAIDDHLPPTLLGYAQVQTRMGMLEQDRAAAIREQIAAGRVAEAEVPMRREVAATHDAKAERHFQRALQLYAELIAKREVLRFAHRHTLEIQARRGDHEAALAAGDAYLGRVAQEIARLRNEVERAEAVAYEREIRVQLQDLIDERVGVRGLIANLLWERAGEQEGQAREDSLRQAIAQLSAALDERGDLVVELFNRGRCYAAIGEVALARADFENFLRKSTLPHTSPQVKEALAYVRENGG